MISATILWPSGFDYPIFRKNLSKLVRQVDEILVCFTEHGDLPLKGFLREQLAPFCRMFDVTQYQTNKYPGDWRNKATNLLIDQAHGDWILSLEQDFLIRDYDQFFRVIKDAMNTNEVISFEQAKRYHPAFCLASLEAINKTHRDFTAIQDLDHYGMFTKQLKGFARFASLRSLGLRENEDWYHMGGLTENYFAVMPYYQLNDFYTYNTRCMNAQVPQNKLWYEKMVTLDEQKPKETEYNVYLAEFLQ